MTKDISAIYETCVSETAAFLRGIGSTDAVIGLSGGIDSALVAAIAVEALGAEHVHGMLLPGPFSSVSSITDAMELAERLGIEIHTASIEGAYAAFREEFAEAFEERLDGTADQNVQARARMVFLMAASNQFGWTLLNTGNKSEAFMGYATLYGDTAGAFGPIGGLYKTQVFEMARWLNEQAREQGKVEPIPESIIAKPPSAELAANQTDEASLGITYERLDMILAALLDEGKDAAALAAEGFDEVEVALVVARMETNAFKRAYLPSHPEV